MVKESTFHKDNPFTQGRISSNGTSEKYFKGITGNYKGPAQYRLALYNQQKYSTIKYPSKGES